jgi:hypothetical protein
MYASEYVLPVREAPLRKLSLVATSACLDKFTPQDAPVLSTSFAGMARAIGFSRKILATTANIDELEATTAAKDASDSVLIVFDIPRVC